MAYSAELVDDERDAAIFGGVVRAAKKAARGVTKAASTVTRPVTRAASQITKSPVWNIAATGASFIPGVGSAVSSGMAAAAALGRGESARDIALAAAKNALPGGPVAKAAFDVAVGAARGQRLDHAALSAVREQLPGGPAARAAFDAGVALSRGQRPERAIVDATRSELSRAGRDAFDRALGAASRARGIGPSHVPITFPNVSPAARTVARSFATTPGFRRLRFAQVGRRLGVPTRIAREGGAAWLRRIGAEGLDWRDVGDNETLETAAQRLRVTLPRELELTAPPARSSATVASMPPVPVSRAMLLRIFENGTPDLRKAILAHGLLAELAHNTGELDGKGGWIIRTGDLPYMVAKLVTGDQNRWKELPSVNPGMKIVTKKDSAGKVIWTGLDPWFTGKRINLPPSWIASTMPELTAPAPAPTPAGSTPAPSVAGGPPFPPPSQYPAGYPSQFYVVQSGDYGTKIAERITGDGARWKELRDANPSTADAKYGMKLYAGQKLTLPPAWVKVAPAAPPPALPVPVIEPPEELPAPTWPPDLTKFPWTTPPGYTPPTATFPLPGTPGGEDLPPLTAPPPIAVPPLPVAVPTPVSATPATPATSPPTPAVSGTTQQVASVQVQLGYFYKAHPEAAWSQPSAPFGSTPTDYDGIWDARSFEAMAGFQKWWNARKTPKLRTDGMPDPQSIASLRAQIDADLGITKTTPGAAPKAGATVAQKKDDGLAPLALAGLAAAMLL